MYNTILSKEGYLIKKNNISKDELKEIRKELTVQPYMPFIYGNDIPESFTVYKENEDFINVPKFYGLSKKGKPDLIDETEGKKVNLEFKGELRDYQKEILDGTIDSIKNKGGGLISVGCGKGKCLAFDTPIIMFNGSIKMVQDLNVGDKIMGDDSKPRNILSLARGVETMYKITQNNGSNYTVNESHILSLKFSENYKNYLKGDVIDISLKEYLELPSSVPLKGYKVSISFPEFKLEIDPYLYGSTLETKNIFEEYKYNSKDNQLKLLAGIIDKFGHVKDEYYVIKSGDNDLLNDISFVSRSLGFTVETLNNKIKISGNNLNQIPVRKWNRNFTEKNDDLTTDIKIEKLNVDNYYGFEIDGNHRFLLGDFTVTHNTVMALNLACRFKVKTLVIVHKTFLLNQWKERAEQFTNANIGIIQQNKIETEGKEIVIGMLQSIAKEKYSYDVFQDFGFVIFDEAHHAPSKYFSRALPQIIAKKALALSATPKRTDKLEKVLFWFMGPVLYKEPITLNSRVIAKIYKYNVKHEKFREAKMKYGREVNRPRTLNRIVKINKRNNFIIDLLQECLLEAGRKVLILSDRINHLEKLKEKFDKRKLGTSAYYIGGMTQKKLKESEEATVILASFGMASEALDIPALNTLIMATPRREVEQSVGRIIRKVGEVQPVVIDIVDQLPCFSRQGNYRRKFYKRRGYQIKLIDVEDNEIIAEEDISDRKILSPVNTVVEDDVAFLD